MPGLFKTDRRIYVDSKQKRVVDEGDPKAAYLLAPAGGEIPEATARRLGLLKMQAKPQDKSVTKVFNK